MDTRLTTTHGPRVTSVWRPAAALLVAVVLAAMLGATSASAASSTACHVQNTSTGQTYERLQNAVNSARSGDQLIVMGTCRGRTVIDKHLVVEGRWTRRYGKPILEASGTLPEFWWNTGILHLKTPRPYLRPTRFVVRGLTVQAGRDSSWRGAGIYVSEARVTLDDVVVRRMEDVGIYGYFGTLRLNGSTRVVGTRSGRGISNAFGEVVMNDSSTIARNRGGGMAIGPYAAVTLNDTSSIRDNSGAREGGGIYGRARITLNDASSIRDNVATRSGGGIFDSWNPNLAESTYWSFITLNDSSSITGNRAEAADSCCGPGCGVIRSRAGGVWLSRSGTLTMNGSSVISDNSATCGAGGLYSNANTRDAGTLDGVMCGPQSFANVYGNTPDDCYFE